MYTFSVPTCKITTLILPYQNRIDDNLINMGMKKILFGLIGIVLLSLNGNAQENNSNQVNEFISGSVKTTFNQESIEYKFKSLYELNESIDEIAKEIDFNGFEKGKMCEIRIEIKMELTSGVTTILISETINTSCDNESVKAATNRLKSMALATRS